MISVGYFTSWSIYARNFNVWDINPVGLTHINYAFANIGNGGVVLGDPWADVDKVNGEEHGDTWSDPPDYLHGNLYQLFRFKEAHRWIKTGISIGGWTWSRHFSDIASTPQSRSKFVKSAIDFALTYGMDFIDLDWEYPVSGGLSGNTRRPEDGVNYALLLQEFKKQFANYPERALKVTAAISCGLESLRNFRLDLMNPWIDHFNMMCYDYTGAFTSLADHQSNLSPRSSKQISAEEAINYAVENGADREKIVMGIPIYGRSFANTKGLNKPFQGVGEGTWEPGIYDYKELPLTGCTPLWENKCLASFCYDAKKSFLISYDTPTSVSYKMRWLVQGGFGGAMTWELSADNPTNDSKSLQRMINIWLNDRLDMSDNELCYPMSPFGNINNHITCPKIENANTEKLCDLSNTNKRPTEKMLEEDLENLLSSANEKDLMYPRAHYNYTQFEKLMVSKKKLISVCGDKEAVKLDAEFRPKFDANTPILNDEDLQYPRAHYNYTGNNQENNDLASFEDLKSMPIALP